MILQPNKEKCDSCIKPINLGQSITERAKCTKISIHTKCYKKSKLRNLNRNFYCLECSFTIIIRDNPYKELIEDSSSDINESALISKMNQDYNLNFYFYNLDGNKSNFDTLADELHRCGDKFSFFGLAETNVDSQHKDLYKLSNYNNFYNDRLPNKSSDTGIALYVHDSLSVKVLHEACTTHPHIETIFAQVIKGNTTLNVV